MAYLAHVPARYNTTHLVVSTYGAPITPARLDVHFRRAANGVPGLPEGFRLHDLRHYFASSLIASGLDIKTVQARVRHKSAKVTLDVYGHLFPDRDDATRDALRSQIRPAQPAETGGGIVSLTNRRRVAGG
jgi:integrase